MNTPPERSLQELVNVYLAAFLQVHAIKQLPKRGQDSKELEVAKTNLATARNACLDRSISATVLEVIATNAYNHRPAVLNSTFYLIPQIGLKSEQIKLVITLCSQLGTVGPFYKVKYDENGYVTWLSYATLPERDFIVVPATKISADD